ncbi:DsrE family protein [Levilactobacillus bambusae]|uniref:Sulfur reduction protein DsrE n=1 Tax=Levilactobacillus bambusae TaxID=2024736 RepID=A0A2V1N0N0_9LACO|nr:DsrE family protein [Levilactobacillus bambusae]PWG00831.1 sulfur reduction protein DsrE [Levilactobacillus bambusae]
MVLVQTKIVFHVDELNKWPEVLSNVTNVLMDLAQHDDHHIQMVVVANGDGIMGYLIPSINDQISELAKTVEFHACHNSMVSHGLNSARIPSGVHIVPVGVIDLASLQDNGYRYLKP